MEKQRLRAQYDISEKQLRRAFASVSRKEGKVGELLVANLETRLDALVLRAGFARTIYQARQFVTHHHIAVNGQRVDRPSYRITVGDTIAVVSKSRVKPLFQLAAAGAHVLERTAPYLSVAIADLTATLTKEPERREIPVICDEQLIVEHYSR